MALHLIMTMKGPEFGKMVHLLGKENDERQAVSEEMEQGSSA
ncbi:hypothetical protein [Streptomyces uncialis]